MRGKSAVPSTRGLLKTIERSIKPAHIIRVSGILKASGLGTINSLGQIALQKSIVDVQLMNRPGT
jgi:hypothetical protein